MRKRSRYRPKGVRLDNLTYVTAGFKPVAELGDIATDLRLRNHMAMTMLTQGKAVKDDVNTIIALLNMMESMWRLGFGTEYKDVVSAGMKAMRAVGARGAESGKFILKADEMAALNMAMELHDAQLEVVTVRDMERAMDIVHDEIKHKRATPIRTTA